MHFLGTPVHHVSVRHVLSHEMQLEASWGSHAPVLECNYKGNRGRTRKNCGNLHLPFPGHLEKIQHAVGTANFSRLFCQNFRGGPTTKIFEPENTFNLVKSVLHGLLKVMLAFYGVVHAEVLLLTKFLWRTPADYEKLFVEQFVRTNCRRTKVHVVENNVSTKLLR